MRIIGLVVFAAALLAILPAAFAQEEDADSDKSVGDEADGDNDLQAEEVVVTASRRKSSWKDAPVMVTVIGKEELENSSDTTVDEFLRRVPSVAVKRSHIAECGPGREMTLRGIPDQKRTLVLVDGIPMNDGFGGSVNWSLIPKQSVERIEIVRGPMSALYGSGAMGGVINIITKVPKKRNETTIKGSYGSFDAYSGAILQGGMFDKSGYFAAGRLYDTDGYMKVEDPEDYHEKNERSEWSLLGKYYHMTGEDSMVTLGAYSVDEDYSRGRLFDHQNNSLSGFHLTFEKETMDGIEVVGAFYGNQNQRKVWVGAAPTYDSLEHTEDNEVQRFGELFKGSFKAGRYNTITAGIDSAYNRFEKYNDFEPAEVTTGGQDGGNGEESDSETIIVEREAKAKGKQYMISLFAQDETTFKSKKHKVTLTAGARSDYCKSFDGEMYDSNPTGTEINEEYEDEIWLSLNPKAGVVYRYADWTTVRLSAGRAFAAPTLSEMYMVFTRGPITLHGNPELEPEKAVSYNAGIDQWLGKDFVARVDGYYTQGDNFISSREIAPNVYENDNITKVQIYGADAELRWSIVKSLKAYAGYTYTESTILEDEEAPETEDNDLAFMPRSKGRLGLTFDNPKYFTLDVSANYVGARYTDIENTSEGQLDEYVSLDAYLARRIGENVTLAVSGENLLDDRYELYSLPSDESYAPGLIVNGHATLSF